MPIEGELICLKAAHKRPCDPTAWEYFGRQSRQMNNHGREELDRGVPAKAAFMAVWGPLDRVSHWLMAAAVLVDWITDEPRWTRWLGYRVMVLVVLRVVWGFLGLEHARFADFVTRPRAVIDYFAGLIASSRGAISGTARREVR